MLLKSHQEVPGIFNTVIITDPARPLQQRRII